MTMSDRVAVCGIGTIGAGKFADLPRSKMAEMAMSAALTDCGLKSSDIDGLVLHIGSPRGIDYDEFAALLGIEVRFASQTWSHGRFCGTVLQHGFMAVAAGLAHTVACVGLFKNTDFTNPGTQGFPGFEENFRESGGPHSETPHVGLIGPIGGAAMSYARYAYQHGLPDDALADIGITFRKNASLNPDAIRREQYTREDYVSSPVVCEPFRRLDCSIPASTATVVLVTTEDHAKSLKQRPVYAAGFQGLSGGPNEFVFGQPGLGINQRDVFNYQPLGSQEQVFEMSGLSPGEIDCLYCYDGFSPQVLWTLERFGFADVGQSAKWIGEGRISLDGDLPMNTNGGHLSEGHTNGWGHTVEIVRQLRGQAEQRQVKNCRSAMWGTTFGDAIVYVN